MSNSVYKINKGINKSIEFKGLKAQYIWYLALGMGALLFLFAVLYMLGVNTYISMALMATLGTGIFLWVYRLSNRYGEHGMKKQMARRSIPKILKSYNRNLFIVYRPAEKIK
jgi:Flp pilus assembly protein TadB